MKTLKYYLLNEWMNGVFEYRFLLRIKKLFLEWIFMMLECWSELVKGYQGGCFKNLWRKRACFMEKPYLAIPFGKHVQYTNFL